jgi:phosphomannomutase
MWNTGHALIKAKLKETGAPLAGEMSGHMFFKERWYGFDDGLYAGARLLEIVSRWQDANWPLKHLPDAISTPELNLKMQEGEPHALVAALRKAAKLRRRAGNHHPRRPARGVRRRLRPDARLQHHAGAGAALRGRHAKALARIQADFPAIGHVRRRFQEAVTANTSDGAQP